MKNPYILTFLVLIVSVGSFRLAHGWQDESAEEKATPVTETQPPVNEGVPTTDKDALQVIRDARTKLFERQTIQADMVQRVSLGNYRFQGEGKYLAASGFRFRLEYDVQLGEMAGSFLEVCDGQILHTRREISEANSNTSAAAATQVELARRDIQKILKATQQHLDSVEAMQAAEIGIGGLPAILASLERSLIFTDIKEETYNDESVFIVQGVWNPDHQQSLLEKVPGGLTGQVMRFLPERVRVTFARETLFPVRFQYLKKIAGDRNTYRPLLTIDFSNVTLDQPVSPQRFTYIAPPGIEERDETALFVQMIESAAAPPVENDDTPENPDQPE